MRNGGGGHMTLRKKVSLLPILKFLEAFQLRKAPWAPVPTGKFSESS